MYDEPSTSGNRPWADAVELGVCQNPRGALQMKRSANSMRARFTNFLLKDNTLRGLGLDESIRKFFTEHGGREPWNMNERREFHAACTALIEEHVNTMPWVAQLWDQERKQR
jgi:hypothetical protein